jgi:serine/threonine-protein kinase
LEHAAQNAAANAQEVDWARVFDEAGLDIRQFTPTAPQLLPPLYADARSAWTGPSADEANAGLRVESAAFNGRPVFFAVVAPWSAAADAPRPGSGSPLAGGALIVGFLLIIAATIGLTRRNIRLGRGDRRGALRLAFASGIVLFVSAMLSSDHVAAASELAIVLMALSWVLFVGAFVWLAYLAIEPSVRRRWPHVLISWTRLLSGQWRDPLVGRDLLIGSGIGILLLVPAHITRLLGAWRNIPPPRPTAPHWETLEGAAPALGDVLHVATEAVFVGVVLLVLLFIARTIVRNQKAAILLVIAAAVGLALPSMQDRLVEIPMTTVVVTAWMAVMLRLGLLAFWSATLVDSIWSDFQPALGVSDFGSPTMIVAVVALFAPALFGFYTSLGGRPLLSARLLED